MAKTTNTNTNNKKAFKLIVVCVLLVISLFLSIRFLIIGISNDETSVNVNSSSDIDYKVYLKENSYYDSNVLDENMKYIASLINYIDTNIDYKITSTKNLDYEYSYYIDATTKVYGDISKTSVLFEKTDVLLEEKKLKKDKTNNVLIHENLKINYNEYNSLIAAFKTSFDLNSVSDVTVALHVNAKAKDGKIKKNITITDTPNLVIPLTEQTIDVQLTNKPVNSFNILKDDKNILLKNIKYFVISLVCFIITIIFLLELFKLLGLSNHSRIAEYKRKLNKILKEYDLIIANVEHHIDEDSYEIINVSSFSELKDVHDNIGNPILFSEIKKNYKSEFIIVKDNFLYKYILTSYGEEKGKNKK